MIVRIVACSLLVCAGLLRSSVSGQPRPGLPQDTLAEVGTRVITARDLIERIELMPWQGKGKRNQHDSAKVKALQSIVAEQLLALEAAAQGLGGDTLTQMHIKGLERLMVRDELFKREVKAKVTVTPQEIRQGIRRYASQLKILLIGTRSEEDAQALARLLRRSKTVDSALSRFPLSFFTRKDSMMMVFGGADTRLEDAAYALTTRNRVSDPLESPYLGWAVLYLVDVETNPEFASRTLEERRHVVERTIRERKESQGGNQYYSKILRPKKAQARPEVFELLASTILDILRSDSMVYRRSNGYTVDSIIDTLTASLWPRLNEELVEIDGGGMTIGEVLEGYRNLQFQFPSLDGEDFRLRLNQSIKDIVAAELLAREGYQQKLHLSDVVKHDVGVWANYWLAHALEKKIIDSIRATDEETMQYLIDNGGLLGRDYEVRVREILTDSLREALALAERIGEGEDMSGLARQRSKRTAWAERGGDSGPFRVSAYPAIGFRAMEQDTGVLVGPVRVSNGYSLFRVLEKRTVGGDSTITFDSLKTAVRAYVEAQKKLRVLNGYVASLQERYGVKFYYDRLPRVTIMPSNMFTKRYIGFGGVMTAVPLLQPLWEWVKDVRKSEEILP